MASDFDVIVVGAGPAGSAAANFLAKKKVKVLMLEKGRMPGEKNSSGGILYGDFPGDWGVSSLVPGFEEVAPLERRIVAHEVVALGAPDFVKGKSKYYRLAKSSLPSRLGIFSTNFETGHDYSILRRPFDGWLAEQAVKEGAILATSTTATSLIIEAGTVVGVETPREEIRAKLVIDASGVTSSLVEGAGLRGRLNPRQLYHGIKKVFSLDPEIIQKRLRVRPGEGRAIFYVGDFMQGVSGGAYLIPNKETLSLGVVAPLDSLVRATTERFERAGKLRDILRGLEVHPIIADLLDSAKPLEFSARNAPKGYRSILKRPYADGFLVAGDALGAFVKIGPMIDGVRRAITSGMMAGATFVQTMGSGSFKGRNLSRYRELLSPIYEDVNRSGRDGFVAESSFVYHTLPRLIFRTRILAGTFNFAPGLRQGRIPESEIGERMLVRVDSDKDNPNVKVDSGVASKSITKPWVPLCPLDCFSVVTSKGEFSSFGELYRQNLRSDAKMSLAKARGNTLDQVAGSKLKFDQASCVSCGTCGAIGPPEMVSFYDERDGRGVSYAFG